MWAKAPELRNLPGKMSDMTDRMTIGPQFGTLVSLPTAIILLVLFFLPWLELRCDMKNAAKMSGNFPKDMELEGRGVTLAHASGWQLTVGDIIPELGPSDGKDKLSKVVSARPWFILGLAVPVILLIGGGAILRGKLAFRPWGKAMVALSVVGLSICVLGINVDYAEDLIAYNNENREKLTSSSNMEGAYEQLQVEDQVAQLLRTSATPVLFSSGILYLLVIVCGVLLLREPFDVATETASPIPQAPAAGLGLQAPPMDPPPQAPARPSSPPLDFGPSVYTPPKE